MMSFAAVGLGAALTFAPLVGVSSIFLWPRLAFRMALLMMAAALAVLTAGFLVLGHLAVDPITASPRALGLLVGGAVVAALLVGWTFVRWVRQRSLPTYDVFD